MPTHRAPSARRRAAPSLVMAAAAMYLTTLGGCAYMGNWLHNGFKVGPDYAKPVAPVADQWIDFNDPRVLSHEHGVDDSAWWTVFGDPQLDQLVESAYQQNLPLRVAALRVLEAQAQRAVAAGNLFPQSQQANLQFQQIQISRAGNAFGVPNLPVRSFPLWQTGFNASWELDLWGRLRRAIESADANLDASVEAYDDTLVALISDTAAAYVELRGFQERLRYAKANVASQEVSLKLAQARFDAGAVSKLDVTQAQANLEQTRTLIPILEQGARQANNRLCLLLGIPPRDLTGELGEAPIPEAPAEVVIGIPADLLRRRPDVREAERKVAAQSARIGIAAAELFPTFSITGAINWQAGQFGDLFSPAANGGVISPSFNWNILNYGRIVNSISAEEAKFQQLAVLYQQTVLSANTEAENAIVTFLKSQRKAEYLTRVVKASEESVELARTQYREGAIDFDRVNNLERQLVLQQDSLATAETEVALGLISIYKALGGGWQIRYGAYAVPEPETAEPGEEVEEPLPEPAPMP